MNKQSQSQFLSQNQIQFMKFLQMSNQELDTWLSTQYNENPFLEKENLHYSVSAIQEGRDYYSIMEQAVYDRTGVQYDLLEQLSYFDYSEVEWSIFRFLINGLDDNGFFSMDLNVISESKRIPLKLLKKCLRILQELEPYGIFAADVEHCLIKQMEKRKIQDDLLKVMILESLEDLLYKKTSKMQKKYGISAKKLEEYYGVLATLKPYPLYSYETKKTHYIIPDVICNKQDDNLEAEIYKSYERYYVNTDYIKMMEQTTDPDLKSYFKDKYWAAKTIVSNIEKREKTLLQITEIILEKQSGFFLKNTPLIPMSMKQLADICRVSISTISRTVNNKYLQYPNGMVQMRDLFIAAANMGENEESIVSTNDVKRIIAEMIKMEDPRKPLSDDEISNRLKKQSIQLSRRAVAKYRSEMFIPTSRERRVRE